MKIKRFLFILILFLVYSCGVDNGFNREYIISKAKEKKEIDKDPPNLQ